MSTRTSTPLLEAMDHGRDGYPRWIVVETTRRRQLTQTAESITTAAVDRGFVALPIDAYLRSRILGANELDERTLLLVDSPAIRRARMPRCFMRRRNRPVRIFY